MVVTALPGRSSCSHRDRVRHAVFGTSDCRKWCKLGGSDCAAGETCTMLPPGSSS